MPVKHAASFQLGGIDDVVRVVVHVRQLVLAAVILDSDNCVVSHGRFLKKGRAGSPPSWRYKCGTSSFMSSASGFCTLTGRKRTPGPKLVSSPYSVTRCPIQLWEFLPHASASFRALVRLRTSDFGSSSNSRTYLCLTVPALSFNSATSTFRIVQRGSPSFRSVTPKYFEPYISSKSSSGI